jgi:hypothetical protein
MKIEPYHGVVTLLVAPLGGAISITKYILSSPLGGNLSKGLPSDEQMVLKVGG